jgi:hypothetical protein
MAAGNGDAQRLEQVERAITGTIGQNRPAAVEAPNGDDVVARVDAAAELCREAGRYAKDHGAYLDELSTAFADKLRAITVEYARNMLAAEERRMAELRRILGKIAG